MKLGAERLKKIKKTGLTRVHVGLESGDKDTLEFMEKGATPEDMIAGGRAAKQAGLELSFYILIGAGGKKRLYQHSQQSAYVCNQVNPDFIRLRTLVVQHGSLLEQKMIDGAYLPTKPIEKIVETKTFLENLDVKQCVLYSDHFTNNIWINNSLVYNGIYGKLPQEKEDMLQILDTTLKTLLDTNGDIVDATILYERGLISSF
jgi:uncharacterized Fe-S cluster-containing MiaB family protein